MRSETLWVKVNYAQRNSERWRVLARFVVATATVFGVLGFLAPECCLAQG
jgi:hypothetical protein